jgi:hypothetical protein
MYGTMMSECRLIAKPLSYARASSSMMIVAHKKSAPAPPYFSSIHVHKKPFAPALRHTSRST